MIDSFHYHKLVKQFNPPEFIKESSIPDKEEVARLQTSRFASPETREFPVHTKAATWLSAAKFWSDALYNPNVRQEVSENLKKAAKFWDIEDDIDSILQSVAGTAKEASETQAFALEEPDFNGDIIRRFPLVGPQSTVKSAQSLYEEKNHLPLPWKRKAAERILKASEDYDVTGEIDEETNTYLEKAAGKGISSLEKLSEALNARYNILHTPGYTHNEEAAQAMEKLAQGTEAEPETSHELCQKVAKVLDQVDRKNKLYRFYGKNLEMPEEACHALTKKSAQAYVDQYIETHGGRIYAKEAFESAGIDLFSPMPEVQNQVMGPKRSLDIEKTAEVVPSLNPSQAAVIQSGLESLGYQPQKIPASILESAKN